VLLPINTPEDRLFTTSMISPQWVWWVAHLALGMTAGLFYFLVGQRQLAAPDRTGSRSYASRVPTGPLERPRRPGRRVTLTPFGTLPSLTPPQ
jgi:hypothetical protein